jgi:hypothetical protein
MDHPGGEDVVATERHGAAALKLHFDTEREKD